MYLGAFQAGDTVKYRACFHDDTGDVENPTSPEAQLETPAGAFNDLTAPAQIDAQVGYYGGSIDTTGFAEGQYCLRVAGTVSTAKTTATEFYFTIDPVPSASMRVHPGMVGGVRG